MKNQDNKKKRVNLSLDEQTLATLQEISDLNAYGSISSAIRIMVKKYGKLEQSSNIARSSI